MGKSYQGDYDISLHAVERYVERIEGGRAPNIMQQRQIDAVRWNIRRDLEHAQTLPSAGELVLMRHGMLKPNMKALVSDTRVYVVKGRKVLTVYDVDSETLALANELAEQSGEGSGIFSPSGGHYPETLKCPPQDDAVRALNSLTIPRNILEVLTGEWRCPSGHNEFVSQLARLRRCAQAINPGLFRKDTDVEPDAAWICFRHDYLRFAVVNGTMAVCVVV
ncbi:MAG: hypothetical protein AAB974_02300 [Patescibacteria group bacterium]